MKIKCTNPKNYNLTLNKEYEVINENDNFYELLNDKNSSVFYSKNLFQVIPEVPVFLSLEDSIDEVFGEIGNAIVGEQTAMSCGVVEFDGLNALTDEIVEDIDYSAYNPDIVFDIKVGVLKKSILNTLEDWTCRFGMLSTTKHYGNFDVVEKAMEGLAELSFEGNNPNTTNDIVVWVIRKQG